MNNEETIIAQPNGKQQSAQTKETEKSAQTKENANRKSGKVATAAASATIGGVVGGVGTAAFMHNAAQSEDGTINTAEEQNVQAEEEQPVVAKVEPTPAKEEADDANVNNNAEPDYTNHDGADPVITTDEPVTAQAVEAVDVQPEVQVLGIYENITDEGVHQTAAVLTNGTEVAVVVDATGDGMADILAVDDNHNNQIDEGEVVDVSNQNVHMSDYQQQYVAQQCAEQQQMDDMAYNASDDGMPDYDNNAYIDA